MKNKCGILLILIFISGFLLITPLKQEEEEMELRRYKDLGIVSAKKPQNTHLWVETNSAGTLYAVDSADNTDLIKTTDKGDNWSTIAERSKDIRAFSRFYYSHKWMVWIKITDCM